MGTFFTAELLLPPADIPPLRGHLRQLLVAEYGELAERPLQFSSEEVSTWHPQRGRLSAIEVTARELWVLWHQTEGDPWELTSGMCWVGRDSRWPVRIRMQGQKNWRYGNDLDDLKAWQKAIRQEQLRMGLGADSREYAQQVRVKGVAGGLPLMDLVAPCKYGNSYTNWFVAVNGWTVRWNETWGTWLRTTKDGEW